MKCKFTQASPCLVTPHPRHVQRNWKPDSNKSCSSPFHLCFSYTEISPSKRKQRFDFYSLARFVLRSCHLPQWACCQHVQNAIWHGRQNDLALSTILYHHSIWKAILNFICSESFTFMASVGTQLFQLHLSQHHPSQIHPERNILFARKLHLQWSYTNITASIKSKTEQTSQLRPHGTKMGFDEYFWEVWFWPISVKLQSLVIQYKLVRQPNFQFPEITSLKVQPSYSGEL